MKWWVRFTLTTAIAIGMAMLLSYLPRLATSGGSFEVFSFNRTYQISDRNVVDYMASLHLQTGISKVDWSRNVLSVDLQVSGLNNSAAVYHDLFVLARQGFEATDNVQRVLVRVLELDQGQSAAKGKLLIAMDAKRESIHGRGAMPKENDDLFTQEGYLRQHFDLTFTRSWKQKFGI